MYFLYWFISEFLSISVSSPTISLPWLVMCFIECCPKLQPFLPSLFFPFFPHFSSLDQSCPTPCDPMDSSLSITNSWSLLKLMSIESVMPSNHLIFCQPLPLPASIFPSIRVFSTESILPNRWPKYWSFSISPFNEYSGLISFRTDWFDFTLQGTQESSPTPQLKSINSSALSFLYGPTLTSIHDHWKNHSLE